MNIDWAYGTLEWHLDYTISFASRYGHLNEIWNMLRGQLPEWKLAELVQDKDEGDDKKDANLQVGTA